MEFSLTSKFLICRIFSAYFLFSLLTLMHGQLQFFLITGKMTLDSSIELVWLQLMLIDLRHKDIGECLFAYFLPKSMDFTFGYHTCDMLSQRRSPSHCFVSFSEITNLLPNLSTCSSEPAFLMVHGRAWEGGLRIVTCKNGRNFLF